MQVSLGAFEEEGESPVGTGKMTVRTGGQDEDMVYFGPVPLADLPQHVRVYEVGPRDGLQNEPTVVDTSVKAEFVERLSAAGLQTVETTSFVRPDRVPQLADAEQLLASFRPRDGVRYPALVPNVRGFERAMAAGVQDIAVFASATETFAQQNLGCSIDESMTMFTPVVAGALAQQVSVRGYVSMCFGDPWEGTVEPSAVVEVVARLVEMGCQEISLGDTIGVATAGQVERLLAALSHAGMASSLFAVHFHDTYGQALANTLTALQAGVTTVDASAGGLGGCPFAKSATGNLATEDLVWMLNGLGIETGIDLDSLVQTSLWMAAALGRPSPSATVRALAPDGSL